MVADLVGDDIGVGELAGRTETLGQLVEEAHVEIDLAVLGAVERPRRRRHRAAPAGVVVAVVEDERRVGVGDVRLCGQQLGPRVLGRGEDLADEALVGTLGAGCGGGGVGGDGRGGLADLLGRGRAAADEVPEAAEPAERQHDDAEHDDPAAPEAAEDEAEQHREQAAAQAAAAAAEAEAAAAVAAVVLDVVALAFVVEPHGGPPFARHNAPAGGAGQPGFAAAPGLC